MKNTIAFEAVASQPTVRSAVVDNSLQPNWSAIVFALVAVAMLAFVFGRRMEKSDERNRKLDKMLKKMEEDEAKVLAEADRAEAKIAGAAIAKPASPETIAPPLTPPVVSSVAPTKPLYSVVAAAPVPSPLQEAPKVVATAAAASFVTSPQEDDADEAPPALDDVVLDDVPNFHIESRERPELSKEDYDFIEAMGIEEMSRNAQAYVPE